MQTVKVESVLLVKPYLTVECMNPLLQHYLTRFAHKSYCW